MKTIHFLTILVLLAILKPGNSQDRYAIDNSNSQIKITGTSNVHNWEMEANGITAEIKINAESNKLKDISELYFSVPAENIKSHNSIMDKKTWDAMNTRKYKMIEFKLGTIKDLSVQDTEIRGTAIGTLSMAGTSNTIEIRFSGKSLENKRIVFEGSKEIRLQDYNISAPTAMMGTLKTGDLINIIFTIQFTSEAIITSSISN